MIAFKKVHFYWMAQYYLYTSGGFVLELPGHSILALHSSNSFRSPSQFLPPFLRSVQTRFLDLLPWPQVESHWPQIDHCDQTPSTVSLILCYWYHKKMLWDFCPCLNPSVHIVMKLILNTQCHSVLNVLPKQIILTCMFWINPLSR